VQINAVSIFEQRWGRESGTIENHTMGESHPHILTDCCGFPEQYLCHLLILSHDENSYLANFWDIVGTPMLSCWGFFWTDDDFVIVRLALVLQSLKRCFQERYILMRVF
jgi:hypothetical protein